jgi:hypothetical protein
MEIKKFEAYNYTGKDLNSINRSGVLRGIVNLLSESEKIFDYEILGTMYEPEKEILYINLIKETRPFSNVENDKVLKIDFSDLGIEIGQMPYDVEKDSEGEFIPERNLDTEQIKQMKTYKKDLKNYNL